MKTYLERINEQTPTRMWVNNPTPSEAKKGLEAGTFGATSNPTYLSHMLKAEETVALQTSCENFSNNLQKRNGA